jgi:MoxR-like ATPase
VQFTPDLMPGDITGSLVYDAAISEFTFRPGPVFTNLLLADEINRTPPKTQSALLEAMEERQVSVDGVTPASAGSVPRGRDPEPGGVRRHLSRCPRPSSTASCSRSSCRCRPASRRSRCWPVTPAGSTRATWPRRQIRTGRRRRRPRAGAAAVRRWRSPEVAAYIVDIARATRNSPSLSLGVSPRGATALLATSRAWAWLNGRTFVTPDDVKALAHATLAHRLSLRPEAELEGVGVASVLDSALASVPVPR